MKDYIIRKEKLINMKLTKKQLDIKKSVMAKLKEEQTNKDLEVAHYVADEQLCLLLNELGFKDVVEEWDKVGKWYSQQLFFTTDASMVCCVIKQKENKQEITCRI